MPRVRVALCAVAVAAAAAVVAGSCHRGPAGGTLERAKRRGYLTWGADKQGGEPYLWEEAGTGKLVGFEVEIMDAIGRRLGVEVRFVHYDWSRLLDGLDRGDFDVAMNGLEATPERADRALLSAPYFIYDETLTFRTARPYRTLAELAGKPVGTLDQCYAQDLLRAQGDIEVRSYSGNQEPYEDLLVGRLEAVLLDNIIADRYGCVRDGLGCVTGIAKGTYVIAVRKQDPELAAAIDAALAAMRADGELQRILERANLWSAVQLEPLPAMPTATAARATSFDSEQLALFAWAALTTLLITIGAFALAIVVGLVLAVLRVYGNAPARVGARIYIELFRGTPVLLQLYLLYFGLGPYLTLGPVTAAVIGLGLNYAAYEAEVYRGALLAIPRGQSEAARALGLGPWQTLRHVLVPQATRLALPAMTNDFVSLLKDSSLVGAISVIELTKRYQILGADLRSWLVPGIACAAFYLALSLPLSELARRLERRLARDQRPHAL
jgi:polar amino acid transport system substrate-binding protein